MVSQPCPICRRPSVPGAAPFCSARCRDVDLQRWFAGTYAVPAAEPEDEEENPGLPSADDEA